MLQGSQSLFVCLVLLQGHATYQITRRWYLLYAKKDVNEGSGQTLWDSS